MGTDDGSGGGLAKRGCVRKRRAWWFQGKKVLLGAVLEVGAGQGRGQSMNRAGEEGGCGLGQGYCRRRRE